MITVSSVLSFASHVYFKSSAEGRSSICGLIYRSFDLMALMLNASFNTGVDAKSKLVKFDVEYLVLKLLYEVFSREESDIPLPVAKSINRDTFHSFVHLLSDELEPSFVRIMAAALVEKLIIKLVPWSTIHEPLAPSLRTSLPKISALDKINRTAAFPRPSDVSRGLGTISCCMRIIIAAVDDSAEWVVKQNWNYLLRLMHDRSATVRALSLHLLSAILRTFRSLRIDLNVAFEGSTEGPNRLKHSVLNIVSDPFECTIVRLLGSRTLLQEKLIESQELHKVLSCCSAALSEPDRGLVSSKSVSLAVDIMSECYDTYPSEMSSLLRSLNILPRVFNMYKVESWKDYVNAVASRAQFTALADEERPDFSGSWWMVTWQFYKRSSHAEFTSVIAAATRFLHKLFTSNDPSLCPDFLLTNIVSYVVLRLSLAAKTENSKKGRFDLIAFRAQADFLCLMLNYRAKSDSDLASLIGPSSGRILSSSLKFVCGIIEKIEIAKTCSQENLQSMSSILRILGILIECKESRACLGLGDAVTNSIWSVEADSLFHKLLRCRSIFQSSSRGRSPEVQRISYQLDATIALFLKRSRNAKIAVFESKLHLNTLETMLRDVRLHILGKFVDACSDAASHTLKSKAFGQSKISALPGDSRNFESVEVEVPKGSRW